MKNVTAIFLLLFCFVAENQAAEKLPYKCRTKPRADGGIDLFILPKILAAEKDKQKLGKDIEKVTGADLVIFSELDDETKLSVVGGVPDTLPEIIQVIEKQLKVPVELLQVPYWTEQAEGRTVALHFVGGLSDVSPGLISKLETITSGNVVLDETINDTVLRLHGNDKNITLVFAALVRRLGVTFRLIAKPKKTSQREAPCPALFFFL